MALKFKRANISISDSDNCLCNVCFKQAQVAKFVYYTQDYISDKTGRVCKHPQKHYHEIWICGKCLDEFQSDWWKTISERSRKNFKTRLC